MTKYKGVDNNKSIAYYFRDLSINIYNDYISKPIAKSFYNKFKQFYISIS